MGMKFKNIIFHVNFKNFGVAFGIKKSKNICRVCGKKINSNESALGVHSFGEAPTYFHPKCAKIISETINAAITGINSK